jgi:hypothetical protein
MYLLFMYIILKRCIGILKEYLGKMRCLCTNVEHGRVVECVQHSHFKSDGTSRAWEVSIGAVEVEAPKSTNVSASNYLIIGSTAECPSLDRQSNAEQSLSFFKPNVAVL